jgi:hypothetical protein
MAIIYTNILHFQTLQNLPKLGIFGLKTLHLATLAPTEIKLSFLDRFSKEEEEEKSFGSHIKLFR